LTPGLDLSARSRLLILVDEHEAARAVDRDLRVRIQRSPCHYGETRQDDEPLPTLEKVENLFCLLLEALGVGGRLRETVGPCIPRTNDVSLTVTFWISTLKMSHGNIFSVCLKGPDTSPRPQ
jgi:hypothetical protein